MTVPRAKPSEARDGPAPRIAFLAFNKHAAADVQQKLIQQTPFTGSEEQCAIWEAAQRGTRHIVVEAVAGSGKTATMVALCRRLDATVDAMTYHSFGLKACRSAGLGRGEPRFKLAQELAETIIRDDIWEAECEERREAGKKLLKRPAKPEKLDYDSWRTAQLAAKLVEYARMQLTDPTVENLSRLADYYQMSPCPQLNSAMLLLPRLLGALWQSDELDFPSMIWRPVVDRMVFPAYDLIIADELQDTSPDQAEMLIRAVGTSRFVGVGDSKQALYGFRGADAHAMRNMIDRLEKTERGVMLLPLSVTRRCPTRVVDLAKRIVPQIRAMEDAPAGEVMELAETDALAMMAPGDMVLCRVNKDLVPIAYALLRQGTKALIKGRDIGQNMLALVDKLGGGEIHEFAHSLSEYWQREEKKLRALGDKGEQRLAYLDDQCGCLMELLSGIETVKALKSRIELLFAEVGEDGKPRIAVVLSSIHKAKGLEADRVFILRPDLMPHPMAKRAHEAEGEACCAYVGVTRTKRVLVFVGGVPRYFQGGADD